MDARKPQPDRREKTGPARTVVGIGASAGGLAALKRLLPHVPPDSGLAFVVVLNLAPGDESRPTEILQAVVRMPVQEVTAATPLLPDHLYVIPPGHDLSAIDTHLRTEPPTMRWGAHATIDRFFRTLAETDGDAIAVVLSGIGSDGARGIRAIKDRGGLVVVQSPEETDFHGMPRSAIATGCADLVLPAAEIPEALLRFVRGQVEPAAPPAPGPDGPAQVLSQILARTRAATGRDFTRYRRTTILRRLTRRMRMQRIETLRAYLERLRQQPAETRALADDLLVTETGFFGEPAAFDSLAHTVLPRLLARGDGARDEIRVWCAGCATGEEAYSVAMLLLEAAPDHDLPPPFRVFATDLHDRALEQARTGRYPEAIEHDVSPERLRRFLRREGNGYRIRKDLRETVVFSNHDLLTDPPFSGIDLVLCRNLLLYLEPEAQREALARLHYTLRPGGVLMFGDTEAIADPELFESDDAAPFLYRKRGVTSPRRGMAWTRPRVSERVVTEQPPQPPAGAALHQRMVERHAPPSMVVAPDDRVVHLSEHAGRYLVHPGGSMTSGALKLVREELRSDLRLALREARRRGETIVTAPVSVRLGRETRGVALQVRPSLEADAAGFALVVFDETPYAAAVSPAPGEQERLRALEAELDLADRVLDDSVRRHRGDQEQMRAANEELRSMNAELLATMDKLQASQCQLEQVNEENRQKVAALAQLSSDLQNFLTATDLATLFLDPELRVVRFTPRARGLFALRAEDRGRRLFDLAPRLDYPDLRQDAEAVLRSTTLVEREVRDSAGRWYLSRVLPYRSVEPRACGVVVVFVDITAQKQVEQRLQESNRRKGQFLATLAHELRNPLAALANGISLLRIAGDRPEKLAAVRPMMERQLGQLVRLIDDLLDVSRISRDRLELRRERVDLGFVVRQALEAVGLGGEDRRLEVALPGEPMEVDGDPVRLVQVFSNLLTNAHEFTDAGGRIRVHAERRGPEIVVTVEDDGAGIPSEKLADIFEMFSQIEPSRRRLRGGLGIGLTLARRLVDMHGGTVEAHSEGPSRGSRFVVRLPEAATEPRREPSAGDESGDEGAAATPGVLRVLAVDDNPDVLATMVQMLELEGHRVVTAQDGEAAVRVAGLQQPDVVLLDIGLPKLDGYEAARRIRSEPWGAHVLLVAVSGWGQDEDRQRSHEAGFDHHLVKPVDPRELVRVLAELQLPRTGPPRQPR